MKIVFNSIFVLTASIGPSLSTENLLQSIAAALHLNNQPLTGQTGSKSALTKNPGVHLNTEQPLVQVKIVIFPDRFWKTLFFHKFPTIK